jgi:hypothetical protein
LAEGVAGDTDEVRVWGSVDGAEWNVIAARAVGDDFTSVEVAGIAAEGSRFVMVGSTEGAGSTEGPKAVAWYSVNGTSWSPSDPLAGAVYDVVFFEGVFVAIGGDEKGPAAWLSSDGASWQRATPLAGATTGQLAVLTAVALGGRGVVAVSLNAQGTVGVWTSADGLTWISISSVGGLQTSAPAPAADQATDVVSGGPGIVIVGSVPDASLLRTSAAVWTNPARRVASPRPKPTPLVCPSKSQLAAIDVIGLAPADRPTCFGSTTIGFTAFLANSPGEGFAPSWLTDDGPFWVFPIRWVSDEVGIVYMDAYRDPKLPSPALPEADPLPGGWFKISGHFDDPRSDRCTPLDSSVSKDEAVKGCRERFVMTAAVATKAP